MSSINNKHSDCSVEALEYRTKITSWKFVKEILVILQLCLGLQNLFPQPGRGADHLPVSGAEVKNAWHGASLSM